jgi:membrane associated rhomboid family serine protease
LQKNMTSHAHEVKRELRGILFFIIVIWAVFLADQLLPLERLGLVPRTLHGIPGIAVSPFLHTGLSHLLSNTVPLLVLLLLLAGSRSDSAAVVASIILFGGGLLWLFGRHARHIGASSLVFGLIAFLLVSGVLERRWPALLAALLVGMLYGTTLFTGILPFQPGVSWDGHLFGAVAGVVTAWWLAKEGSK